MKHKFVLILSWSDHDQAYVVEVPKLPGCSAHGSTHQEVLENIYQAMDLWVDTAREFGDPVSEPKGRRLMVA